MKKFAWLGLSILLLGACGTNEAETSGAGNTLEEVVVEFNTGQTAEVGEEVTLSVTVTQGGEAVEDADEVVYEVWESGHRKDGEMITAEHTADGIYEAETVFEEEGLYYMQAHTTARRLHAMPKQEVTIGNPDPESIVPDDSEDSEGMNMIEEHGGH
ncbi:FixH family protein [Planomicrobium sp. CPCC 101079]|uniref:FixH family protein n=1 Tax=Planomicrobium sp. CPCC 101079 TaxID=2599618 RepID=UPI0011B59DA3|nr:FixH family protein [Planomicrobium sp. CPCC 101079]TWT00061.1 FixH family protein [Planomicrobium sp. CPCC 101079]